MDQTDLPPQLELDGTFERMIELLYMVFRRDFLSDRTLFRGLPVLVDNRKIDSDKEEGFWHVITRGKSSRLLDYKRAKRLPWLKPLIEHPPDPDILCWREEELDGRRGKMVTKHYIWYESGDYLIVLKEIPRKYFLTTAFHVTGQREHDYYSKRYRTKKEGTGC